MQALHWSPDLLTIVSIVKLVAEIALMALLGQAVLGLLAGAKRDQNLFYQMLQIMTRPFVTAARWISPKVVLDRHLPIVAFLVLFFVWLLATFAKINICVQAGMDLCK